MNSQAPQHQRIRFRRSDIIDLDALPSANTEAQPRRPAPGTRRVVRLPRHRVLRWFGAVVGIAVTLVLVVALAVYLIGVTGIGKEKLRQAAEHALERAVGRDMTTVLGTTRISLDGSHLVSLEVADVGLSAVGQPRSFAKASSLRFGIELGPLLSGRLVLGGASLSGASIDPGALGRAGNSDWLAAVRREDGLVDPDKIPPVLFGALQRTFVALERDFSGKIELTDVSIVLPIGSTSHVLTISAAETEATDPNAFSLIAEGTLDGRPWSLSGLCRRDPATGRVALLEMDLAAPQDGESDRAATTGSRLGALHAELKAEQGVPESPSAIRLHFTTEDSAFDLKNNRGLLSGAVEASLRLEAGTGAITVDQLRLSDARSSAEGSGSIRPRETRPGAAPAYALTLDGSKVVLAAADSPEAPLAFKAKLSGSFEPASRRLVADAIDLTAGEGTLTGSAGMQFVEGKSSGIDLALAVSAMPVAGAKQLWPWFTARGLRAWAQDHLSGGTVEEGRLDYHMAPGRIGSGVPPTPEELSGSVTITGTQFDTAGDIPPIVQADGLVSFKGTDADVAVSTARMVLPSGRTLVSTGGSLALRAVNKPPVIGRLDVDLDGEAAGAAELAGFKPIDALKHVPFAAGDLSGTASGHVSADIPFSRDVPRDALDFAVSLRFNKLNIAKPLEGQTLRDADGTLAVDPQKAVIQASALLNGAPAKLNFTEPLKDTGPARSRKIEVSLDDKSRNAIAPGLSTLMSGPVVLDVDASAAKRLVHADLSRAKLSAPWVGWSKGAGVPASADFSMTQNGGGTTISDLNVSGSTFRLAGSLSLDKSGLASAQFPSVQLNRNDQIAVQLRRQGNGYDVSVSGKTYDARALVKAATAQAPETATVAKVSAAAAPSVSLSARVENVSGFGGEALKGVAVAYRSGGGQTQSLRVDAATDTGATVAISDGTKSGQRRLELQTADAGSMLRFLNIYANMQGGAIDVALAGPAGGTLKGKLSARSFVVVNEPRLGSLVSTRGEGAARSLQDAVKKNIDTSRVHFDQATADIEKGQRSLVIDKGVLRGATIGSTFQGTLYDEKGRMDMTGTFMPAYGLNRLFGELPLIGLILGNGNDRGLIGVTFKLQGSAKAPTVTVNPLSVIAPGIFRQIFEFH